MRFLRWASIYRGLPELDRFVSDGILVAGVSPVLAAFATLLAVGAGPRRKVSSSHGSGHWGNGAVLREETGLLIGRGLERRELLRFDNEGHLLTLAPTRSGEACRP